MSGTLPKVWEGASRGCNPPLVGGTISQREDNSLGSHTRLHVATRVTEHGVSFDTLIKGIFLFGTVFSNLARLYSPVIESDMHFYDVHKGERSIVYCVYKMFYVTSCFFQLRNEKFSWRVFSLLVDIQI